MPLLNRDKLAKRRKDRGISVIEMAETLGVDRTTYYKKEKGTRAFNDAEIGIVFTKLGVKKSEWGSFFL